MIFRELSNAAFRFSLRRPGAEIMGGRSNAPPPPAGGGKSRGPAGRGLTKNHQRRPLPLPPIRSRVNTRTGGGGGKKCQPLRFFADSGKTAAHSAAIFQYLLTIGFDTLCKNFSPRSPKVRSPGQVSQKRVSDFEAAQWPH